MKFRTAGLAILLFLTSLAASGNDDGDKGKVDDLLQDAASSCGKLNANAFGAIGHLPAARIVAYDPVTNSIGSSAAAEETSGLMKSRRNPSWSSMKTTSIGSVSLSTRRRSGSWCFPTTPRASS
ncbi:MAG TPA: hypothetical protein VLC46_17195 [Thermoanaerobaculia bacterium]|jgi:hypothetical protein|nr:hypothetical protein [Thermoanaerobaculia bacterium]